MEITRIELDLEVFNKPKIKFYAGDRLVKDLEPPQHKAYEVFSEINNRWVEDMKKKKENK